MRYTKVIGLVAVAAIVAMAFVGASSAMANGETSWCKVRQIPCQAANLYPGGTHFKAEATNTELLTSLGVIVCGSSVLLGNLLNELANPLLGEITALTYANCTLNGNACEVKSPAVGHLLFLRTAGYAGTATSHNTSTLVKCVAAGIHCVFGGLRVLTFTSTGGGAEKEEKEGVPTEEEETKDKVTKESGALCPATAEWDTRYVFSLPTPIYLSA
jgi:hypothetical protein